MPVNKDDLKLIANSIRTLSMDAVQKANSGHPGMPMGCADIAAVLWSKYLNHNPSDPKWINRDRFVLSAGHGSMLLYSLLHFSGYGLTLDDIKNFRQLDSLTPGHPEFGHTPGVETTTGPLGQGFANGVGMAIAEKLIEEEFNNKERQLIEHYIYAIAGDGDMMEGISSEAASVAGHMELGNIIYFYDSNRISIEGSTDLTFSEDTGARFRAYNWHVQEIDGHDFDEIENAIIEAQKEKSKPSLIIARTHIAKGSPGKQDSENSHGAPLGVDEVKASKIELGCNPADFFVPERVYSVFEDRGKELTSVYEEWNRMKDDVLSDSEKSRLESFFASPDVDSLRKELPVFDPEKSIATRSAGGKVLEKLFELMPNLVGGSADLGPSNKTFVKGFSESGKGRVGRNIHFGVREHAMGAIQNGMAYYGGFIPFSATFFVFFDYMRPAVRIAALSGLKTIYVFTHDSIFVGEDGPTHQPVEHLAVSRAIPNLTVIRPADANETSQAWLSALSKKNGPTMLVLTRQNLPIIKREEDCGFENLEKGAYIIRKCDDPDIIILASGSEVHISIDAAEDLEQMGIRSRVVSFPSWELFDEQGSDYKELIIPDNIPVAVVEAGRKMGWEKYAGRKGLYLTLERFGASAPAGELAETFGFTRESIVEHVRDYLQKI